MRLSREAALSTLRNSFPASDAERQAVRQELERLLASPLFRHSRRYPAFLRYVVERTVAGQGGLLKERSLGIDLFERAPDYDTNADHIVRTTAAEIRKRIAQFYQEPGNDPQVRIELPPGSYVPEFRPAAAVAAVIPPEPIVTTSLKPRRRRIDRRTATIASAAVVLACLIALAMSWRLNPVEQASARFWGPVLNSPGEVTICVTQPGSPASPLDPASVPNFMQLHFSESAHVSVGDAEALARIASFLGSQHKSFQIRRPPVSLSDLRHGAVVLIGGFNNEWTIRLTGELRFHFEGSAEAVVGKYWIKDRIHPENKDWVFDFGKPANSSTEDYGLITRVSDATTGRQLITAAGIAKYGTVAAGEFLTNPNLLAELERRAPKGWSRKNVQIVIRTKVISDNSGSPEIVAVATW